MGAIKRLLEEEAARQGTEDISATGVFQAAQRRLDVKRRQYFLERLTNLMVNAYGSERSVASILLEMTDQEITESFTQILQELQQEGREICSHFIVPEPVLTRKKIMEAVKNSGTTCSRCEYENDEVVYLDYLDKVLKEMESEPDDRDAMRERHMEMMAEERRLDELTLEANKN